MHQRNFALWCCKLLFVASSLELRQNFTNSDNKQNDNSMMQYEVYMNTIKNKDENKVELLQSNLRENSTKIDDKDNSTSDYGNFTKIENETETENRNNSTLYTFHENINRNDNINIVPYEMCDNITCIQLCCPLGDRFNGKKCIAGKGDYPFPDVYAYTTSDLPQNEGKKLDELFQLVIYDPCQENERFLLDPDEYPDDEYMFLTNGSLYQPHHSEFIQSRSYCLAVVHRDKFEVTICFEKESMSSDTVMPVSVIVSLSFLLATFMVYSILPELWNKHGYILLGYVGSWSVANMCLIVFLLTQPDVLTSICITMGFIIYFSFLASFFWLNVMCLDIWWTFRGFRSLQENMKRRDKKKFIIYSIYAWGSATILTIVCAIMDFVPNIPKEFIRPEFDVACWINTDAAKTLYFYGPMSITIICNTCLFISTALNIARQKKDTAHDLRDSESQRHNDNKQWCSLYLKLFIVMGLYCSICWCLHLVSWYFNSAPEYFWYFTGWTNMLQGVTIFIIFVCNEKIKRLLLKRFGYQNHSLCSR